MKNKRGQYYLLAAALIILALSGLATVTTYSIVKTKPRTITDLGLELKEESVRIVDYGIYSNKNITQVIENFTKEDYAFYFLKKTYNTSVVFVYGNKTELYGLQYTPQATGTISASIGGGTNWNVVDVYVNKTKINVIGESVDVSLLGKKYNFKLKDNEMFYFVIAQEKEDEIYIEKN